MCYYYIIEIYEKDKLKGLSFFDARNINSEPRSTDYDSAGLP